MRRVILYQDNIMKSLHIYVLLFAVLQTTLFAKVHYAKVEPVERTTIKSSISGAIDKVDLLVEGHIAEDSAIIHIDDKMDRVNLKSTQSSLELLNESLKLNLDILDGLKDIQANKKSYYRRVSNLRTSSRVLKDNSYDAYISSSNQMLATKEKVINLKKQILDLEQKVTLLSDSISKKSISADGKYIYSIMVREGGYATPGMPLLIVDDLSMAKLVVYLDRNELDGIEDKSIYIDDKKTDLKFTKIWSVADEKFVSSYRAEIITKPLFKFSKLVKIEMK